MTERNSGPEGGEGSQAPAGDPDPGGQLPGGTDWQQWEQAATVLAAVNGVWALPVMLCLASGVSRPVDLGRAINANPAYAELVRRLRGIQPGGRPDSRENRLSTKMLIETLGRLVGSGLVTRSRVRGAVPRESHYWPTGDGHAILNALSRVGAAAPAARASAAGEEDAPPDVDTSKAHQARVWNALIGGKDNFRADREAVAAFLQEMPSLAQAARLARRFLNDAIRTAVAGGVTQFLDIGTGLPAAGAVHETAQRLNPASKVVYVDNDPQVLAHARALLNSPGSTAVVEADIRDPDTILARAAETLDLDQPVAIVLMMILHFIPDADDPRGIVRRLADGTRGDCWLIIGHAGSDIAPAPAQAAARRYNERAPTPLWLRSREEVTAFFAAAGVTLMEPGVVPLARWWPSEDLPADANGHVGIGTRKR